MTTADLRRLAEAGIAGTVGRVTPETWQTILALLDERARWKKEATVRAGQTALFRRERDAAERRVAALEGQIDAIREAWEQRHVKPEWMDGVDRALLAAAPSEPPDEYMCPNCVTPWKCNGPHIPAALPAEDEDIPEAFGRLVQGGPVSEASDE